ncbi:MAG: hypothetical protein EAY81_04630 [Bacteroidetes bacterium]|nr:MAG: hypothetical protein EAY81_04630 [Bacteroidota bacterium]
MITVLVEQDTARLRYVLAEVLGRRLGMVYTVTDDVNEVDFNRTVVINYTHRTVQQTIPIVPSGFLAQTFLDEVSPITITNDRWHTLLWPNHAAGKEGIPFDLFSAVFYLLSRYEEYFRIETDRHGRFTASMSLAYKRGFLRYPLVEHWCEEFKKVILKQAPNLRFKQHTFSCLSTIDIDFAYLYNGLSAKWWFAKLALAVLRFNIKSVINQVFATINRKYDPYNSYEFIRKNTNAPIAYFMLMSDAGGYDKNINPKGVTIKRLMLSLSKYAAFIGLHPSYGSNMSLQLVQHESDLLQQAILQPVYHSRQHYLMLSFPHTYNTLVRIGITDDYTMVYADEPGFRASTCMPFNFFNVLTNQPTSLVVHSTCIMDVTLSNYLKVSTTEAKQIASTLLEVTKQFNGDFITLWHNNSFTAQTNTLNLKEVYCALFNKPRK